MHWPQKDGGTECFNKAILTPSAKQMLNNASAPGQIRLNFPRAETELKPSGITEPP